MPKPSPRKWMKSREMSESPEREKSKFDEAEKQQEGDKSMIRRKINPKLIKEIKKHIKGPGEQKQMIKLLQDALALPAEAQEIIIQNPSCWIKSLSSNFTWTHREFEWYFAEDRFLFAATGEEFCDQWVCILNWLLAKYSGEEQAIDINNDI